MSDLLKTLFETKTFSSQQDVKNTFSDNLWKSKLGQNQSFSSTLEQEYQDYGSAARVQERTYRSEERDYSEERSYLRDEQGFAERKFEIEEKNSAPVKEDSYEEKPSVEEKVWDKREAEEADAEEKNESAQDNPDAVAEDDSQTNEEQLPEEKNEAAQDNPDDEPENEKEALNADELRKSIENKLAVEDKNPQANAAETISKMKNVQALEDLAAKGKKNTGENSETEASEEKTLENKDASEAAKVAPGKEIAELMKKYGKADGDEKSILEENIAELMKKYGKENNALKNTRLQANGKTRHASLAEKLEEETGVQIKKISFSEKGNSFSGLEKKGTDENLLEKLMVKGRIAFRRASVKSNAGNATAENLRDVAEKLQDDFKINVKSFTANTNNGSRIAVSAKSATTGGSLSNNSGNGQFADQMQAGDISAKSFGKIVSQSASSMADGNMKNINVIQDIMTKVQGMLKNSPSDGPRMSIDFKTVALGNTHMSLQQRGESLELSVEVGNQSSRQDLMKQREELAQQLRDLGYKEVSVDISGGSRDNNESDKASQDSGNDEVENVKLAGNDELDLEQILAM